MGRTWRKSERSLWGDRRFRDLSAAQPNAQTLWLYLLTGDLTSCIPGVVVAGEAALAEKLRWPLACATGCNSCCCFRKAFSEIAEQDMAKADWDAGLVVLNRALLDDDGRPRSTARPQSPNVLKSWIWAWEDLPDSPLKDDLLATLEAFAEALGKAFAKAFAKAFGKGFAKGCDPVSGKASSIKKEIQIKNEINPTQIPQPPGRARPRDPGSADQAVSAPSPLAAQGGADPSNASPVSPQQVRPSPDDGATKVQSRISPVTPAAPPDPRALARRQILAAIVPLHVETFNRVRDELGLVVPAMQPVGDPAERALLKLMDAQVVFDGFEEACRHVLAIRELEARKKRTVKHLGASVWTDACFSYAKTTTLAEAKEPERAAPLARGRPAQRTGLGGLLDAHRQEADDDALSTTPLLGELSA